MLDTGAETPARDGWRALVHEVAERFHVDPAHLERIVAATIEKGRFCFANLDGLFQSQIHWKIRFRYENELILALSPVLPLELLEQLLRDVCEILGPRQLIEKWGEPSRTACVSCQNHREIATGLLNRIEAEFEGHLSRERAILAAGLVELYISQGEKWQSHTIAHQTEEVEVEGGKTLILPLKERLPVLEPRTSPPVGPSQLELFPGWSV